VFHLLAVKEGYTPTLSAKWVDPKSGAAKLTLTASDLDRRDPELIVKGRVLDEDGKPVASAAIEPFGFMKGDRGQFGGLTGFDALALTNDQGEFRLGVPEKGLTVTVQVAAPRMARRNFANLVCGQKGQDLTLFYGVTIVGRLLKDGKPLAGVGVGLAQTDRNVQSFLGDTKAATDEKGTFRIPNVAPNEAIGVYGLMDSLKEHGALGVKRVQSGKSGSELDLGDLVVQPGFHLRGRVVLADGKPVPVGTRIVLSREEAWDHQLAQVGQDGAFEFKGLPRELVNLSTNVNGYVPSPENGSYDLVNQLGLAGMINANIDHLRFLMEKGSRQFGGQLDQKTFEEYQRRRSAPLSGAPE
jgi:hypothetical protein